MSKRFFLSPFFVPLFLCCIFYSCNNAKQPPKTDIAATPEELDIKATDIIRGALEFATQNNGNIGDTIRLAFTKPVQLIYEKYQFGTFWSSKEQWIPLAVSMMKFIQNAKLYGLFPDDYHFSFLDSLKQKFLKDTLAKSFRRDAVLWSKADLLLTDAFVHIIKDLKLGRLPQDSVTQRKDSVLTDSFYLKKMEELLQNGALVEMFQALEPQHQGYKDLKAGIRIFLDSADNRVYTVVPMPKENPNAFPQALQHRLYEAGFIAYDSVMADSTQLADAVKKFQRRKGIQVDGKAGSETIRIMNDSDRDKFVRIAITLDRYKMLPEKMPSRYIWVNLPGYKMSLIEEDSVLLSSKIICGKNITPTPLLTSAISQLITYPQWTIPQSIIVKEILPALKKNPGYLASKGYSLITDKGDVIDPYSVDWSKYKKGIPYKVVQGSGDENALGILKFNFPNSYFVYLHDTNQRYLFSRAMRSLSHGCVRVQEWEALAYYIVRYDYKDQLSEGPSPVEDSLTTWLERKEKHTIPVRKKLPVFIQYFTCEEKNGKLLFYDDIYGYDKDIHEKLFAGK